MCAWCAIRPSQAGVRPLYENVVPNQQVAHIDAPDAHLCRFTKDGRYLVRLRGTAWDLACRLPLGAAPSEPAVPCAADRLCGRPPAAGDL